MKRLRKENVNSPELSYELFEKRWRKQLHYIDFLRFKALARYFKGGKYLDLGVFNSPMPIELKRDYKSSEIWGLDYCAKLIDYLKSQFPDINYVASDVMKLPFEDKYFDYVVAGELIEHLENPKEFLKEAFRVLRFGGILALSTPLAEGITEQAVSEEHLWGFEIEDIREMLKPYGKVEIEIFKDTVKSIIAYTEKIIN